jgi:flagellar protein FlaG
MNASSAVLPSEAVTPSLPLLSGQTGKDGGVDSARRRPGFKEENHGTAGPPADEAYLQRSAAERATAQRHMQEAVQRVNEALETFDATALKLSYDRERELVVIQVIKGSDGPGEREKVIRQIPPEELLRLAGKVEELQGVLYDHQV